MKKQFTAVMLLLTIYTQAQIGIGTTTPTSTLDVRGSLSLGYRAFTTSTSAATTDNTLVFTGTATATLTLPTATTAAGRIYSIKNASSNSSVLTIATTSAETIDGLGSWTLSQSNIVLVLMSNGTNWYATSESLPGNGTGTSWLRGGNNLTSLQNMGTTSNFALPFITNNTEKMRLTTAGYLGIGNTNPGNYLEVSGTNTATGLSGLRLTNLGTATTAAANSKVLSVNSTGDIIVTNNPAASQWLYTGNAGINAATNFLGTTDDKQMIIKSNSQPYLEFGRRQTLGLTQGYIDYNNNDEKVTYVRSALQFEAANAAFYKPKMFTDADGNFRVKGSSAGTDYFEFGSTGTANSGGFEFIIGDDGDEPILFKSYHYINGMSEIMRLQSGRMAVGSNAFNATNPEKLLIDAGVTTSYNLMTGKGSIDNYLQINVQNRSNGASASSDLVATNDVGTETSNYIDMGINSSQYNNNLIPVLNGINNTYLFGAGSDFKIGNLGNNKNLAFFTTPDATQANAAERLRILGSGNVGIANAAPTEKLDVTGNIRFSGALMPNNSAGTAGYVLVSSGAGAAPVWQDGPGYAAGSSWLQGGNTFTAVKNFGTISNHDLPFITNNTEKMRIAATGTVGIGTSTFSATNPERLIVNAGTPAVSTDYQNVIVGKGNTNSYAQLNIQNTNAGTAASSDVVATANNGSETVNFIDMGINSGGNTSTGVLGGANTAYLYSTGNDFVIGNSTTGKDLSIFTTTGGTSTERIRILSTGNVGINVAAPVSTLDVNGSTSAAITITAANITLDATHSTVILSSGTSTVTLPSAASSTRRIYTIVNQNTILGRTISSYKNLININTTSVPAASSITIQSDGTNWYQIR